MVVSVAFLAGARATSVVESAQRVPQGGVEAGVADLQVWKPVQWRTVTSEDML